jgi:hypothetical protein
VKPVLSARRRASCWPVPWIAFFASVGLLAGACGNGDDDQFERPDLGEDYVFQPIVATTEQVVGNNRFAFQVLDRDSQNVADADATLRLAYLGGSETELGPGHEAAYIALELEALGSEVEHVHADGSAHFHSVPFGSGLYVANLTFDRPGEWGVEFEIDDGESDGSVPLVLTVLEDGSTPGPGDPAPRTENYTLADRPLNEISSDPRADPSFYQQTVAGAIADGRPVVVAFATPAFCHSRVCEPVLEVVKEVKAAHANVAFIHIEPFENLTDPENLVDSPFVAEWGLPNEPWVFVVDANGIVSAAFEGPFTTEELEAAVAAVDP